MTRNFLCAALLTQLVWQSAAMGAIRDDGSMLYDNIPEGPGRVDGDLERYTSGREARPLGWTPQGALLIATRFAEFDQLHLVETPRGERRQITFEREPIVAAAFSPDPAAQGAYVYAKDPTGNGNTQLYFRHVGGRGANTGARLLTDGTSRNGGALWSNAGRQIAFSNAHEGGTTDIELVEPESEAVPHLAVAGDSAQWDVLDWSPDDRKLLVLKSVSANEGYLYVVDLATAQKREIDPAPGKIRITAAKFSRDGQGVFVISDRDGDYAKLRYVGFFSSEKTTFSGAAAGDVRELAVSPDGRYLAYVTREAGSDKLNVLDLRAHQDLTPPRLEPGVIEQLTFDSTSNRLSFGFSSNTQPRDAYVLDLHSNRVEPWTRSETGPVDASTFVTPRLMQYPSFDRTEGRALKAPVYVYEPAAAGVHPVLIWLHDGPQSQFSPAFEPFLQYLVAELGFAVLVPNVRGSSGYGKAYLAADNGTLRDDVVKDLGALIVWIGSQNSFDAKHVTVGGSGYGGYLALAALVNYNERLVGAVDVGGISDFITFLSASAPHFQTALRAEYGDERDPDMRAYLRRISPLTNADRVSRPVLIVHGDHDLQIPLAQSDQMVNRLRSRGSEVWYLRAKNEGHSFDKKSDLDAYYATCAQFLKRLR